MSADRVRPVTHVAAAAILDTAGRVLIAQRPPGKHLAGGWEFPGGKVNPGETPLAALGRELREELGIEMGAGPHRPVRRVRHSYPDREVFIEVWLVRQFEGLPRGLEGQSVRWCLREELRAMPLLPADEPIIDALALPECLVKLETPLYSIGTRKQCKLFGVACSDTGEVAVAEQAGAEFVVLRGMVAGANLPALCGATVLPVFAHDIDVVEAWAAGASGIHQLEFELV